MFKREAKKKCFAIGCEVRIPTRLLMCARHWAMVPSGLQLSVNTHLAEWKKGGSPRKYIEVIKLAAEAVAKKEDGRRVEAALGAVQDPRCTVHAQRRRP